MTSTVLTVLQNDRFYSNFSYNLILHLDFSPYHIHILRNLRDLSFGSKFHPKDKTRGAQYIKLVHAITLKLS